MSATYHLKGKPSVNEHGELCIPVRNVPMARQWVLDFNEKREYVCEFREYHKTRSLDANAYAWVLMEKLAQAVGSTKEEIYKEAIKNVGVWRDFHNLSAEDAKTLSVAWGLIGTGWVTEQVDYEPDGEHVVMRAYYGSSKYNKKQMARLIDNIVQDCKSVGIETGTPEQLARMKEEWS